MAHPDVSFNLQNEGRLMLNVPPTNHLNDRLFDLLGLSATKLIELQSHLKIMMLGMNYGLVGFHHLNYLEEEMMMYIFL